MKHNLVVIELFIAIALLLASCGGQAQATNNQSHSLSPQTTSPTPTPTPTVPRTADQLLQGLKAQHMPIGDSFTYNEENDLNKLLGRPGQYIGKLNFKDTRIPNSSNVGAEISVDDGGSIETFANEDDAAKRFKYVQTIATSGVAIFAEYDYLEGFVILRISRDLTPKQAKGYDDALKVVLQQ